MGQKGDITEVRRMRSGWVTVQTDLDKKLEKELKDFYRRCRGRR